MEKSKTVLVSTFNNSTNNYGAVFQSCALSRFLAEMGYYPSHLSLKKRESIIIAENKRSAFFRIKNIIHNTLCALTKRQRKVRARAFLDFISKTQNLICYDTYSDLESNPPIQDIYLSGSDQVWNPKNIHKEMFLSFAPKDKIKISYAASMGNEIIPSENFKIFDEYIRAYDAISVREDTMIPIIRFHTRVEVHQNIDPVFLLTKNQWIQYEKTYPKLKYKKYIFVYLIEWDKRNNNKLKQLKKETGLPIVAIIIGGIRRTYADQCIFDASPEQFLYLLHHAELVVTSSFHGTALSIVYNKPFFTVAGTDKPSRIESLLRHFDLMTHNTLKFNVKNAQADFEKINGIISEDRVVSEQYLRQAIEG